MSTNSANPPVTSPATSPVAASVVFLKIKDYAAKSVSEQAVLRDGLGAAVAAGVAVLPEHARLVLEAVDGAAIVVLDDPLAALNAAGAAARADSGLAIGINYGPLTIDVRDQTKPRLRGDGLEVAAIIANFAAMYPAPKLFLASRAFHEVLHLTAPARAEQLYDAGSFDDEQLRTHQFFAPNLLRRRTKIRQQMLLAVAAVMGILFIGLTARVARLDYEEAHRPAILFLDIKPTGEIYVDEEFKGTSPPVSRITLTPGPHRLEIRNGKLKPINFELNMKPGEMLPVQYVFVIAPPKPAPRKPAPPPKKPPTFFERLKFWQ